MKAKIFVAFLFVFFIKTTAFSQFTGGVQDGYASGQSIKKIIADTIVVSPFSTISYCQGAPINIDFFARIAFNAGNIFTAQLSDASGSFASPITLGTLVGTTTGTIAGTIPLITPAGVGYRVRVVSTSPVFISQPNTVNIVIKALPIITASSNSPICQGSALNLTSSLAGADSYSWSGPNTFTDNVQNPVIPAATVAATGTYSVTAVVSGCSSTATTSAIVNATPLNTLAVSDATICNPASGNVVITITNAENGYLYELRTSAGIPLSPPVSATGAGANLNLTVLQANAPLLTTTYSVYSSIGGCLAVALTDQPTVTVTPATPQTITGASPLCIGQTNIYTSTTPGGTWLSGTPANATIDPATGLVTGIAAGTSIISYSVVTGACTNTASFTVTINPSPVITASSNSPLCEGQNLNFNLVAPGATSYIWAGPNSFSNIAQNPTIASVTSAAAGIYSVTATIAGCSSTTTTTVVVNPLPSLTFVTFLDTCLSVAPFPMYGATPAGGTYSGIGISGLNFDPLIAGLGFHPITYTYTDPISSCSNSIIQNVFVNDVPTVILNTFLDTCLNVIPFALYGGSPAGGVYSGPGVNAAGIFDPSIAGFGPQVINYTYTTPDGCVNSTTQNITIFDVPTVTLNTFTDTCISTADFALFGGFPVTDANGTGVYSGTGVDGMGVFSPTDAGVGTHLITYTYTTTLGGCISMATQNVVVDSLPIVTFTSFVDTCTTVIPFTLSGGLPLGGNYSGIGVTANIFNPLIVGADTIELTYTYTDGHGCTAIATDSSIVVAAPIVSFTSFTDTCISVLPFSLSGGIPAGGVYSGLGVNSGTGVFDPMIAGAGSDTLVYTYTDITGCSNIAKDTVVVNPLPIVTITTFADTCINVPAFNLFGGMPAGGTYSGIGVNSGTGIFDPIIAGAGNDTIFYTYTDLNGCANVDSQAVVVFAAPIPNAGPDIAICFGTDTVITASGGLFYQWTPATGLNASNIANPIASPDLTTIYIVAVSNAQGCIASDTMVLTVHTLPIVNAGIDTVICFGNSVELNAMATGTLTYVWTPSDSLSNDSIFNPIANPTNSITYIISVIDSNGCVGTDNITIGVKPLPFVELNSDAENNTTYTGEVVTFTSTPAGYVNYQFFVNGSSMLNGTNNLYLTSALENGQLVNVVVTENGCSNSSDTLLMTVRDLPNAFTPNGDGQNDRFAKGIELEVFNRWGQLIYKGIDGWDGKFDGKVVAPETYFYTATLYDVSDNKTVKKGTVSVVEK